MKCARCGGTTILETYEGTREIMPSGTLPGVRCLNCGAIEDAVILSNRRNPPQVHSLSGPRLRNWTKPGLAMKLEGGAANQAGEANRGA